MSEMKDMMTRKIFLDVCMGTERLCADLYHCYGKVYEDIPEVNIFWKKAARDKENLQKHYELLLQLLNEIQFDVPRDSLERAYGVRHKLLNLIGHVKNNKPDLATACSKAAEIEENLADMHDHPSLNFSDVCMLNLFKILGVAERDHVAASERSRTILHRPHCEMGG